MGGMVVVVEQACHDTFDAIVVLGHGADGTWAALTDDERLLMDLPDEERERAMVELARVRARGLPPDTARRAPAGSFFEADVPRAVKRAFGAQRTELLFSCALSTMVPGHTDAEKASVTVPVLLVFGDHDLTDDFEGNAARYRVTRTSPSSCSPDPPTVTTRRAHGPALGADRGVDRRVADLSRGRRAVQCAS